MSETPSHIETFDQSLRTVWDLIEPLPTKDWCLAGGTGLVLYYGHRLSTDLDWCVPEGGINTDVISDISSFEKYGYLENVQGGAGLVDCVLQPYTTEFRAIKMTFIEPYRGFFPKPRHPPRKAKNPAATPVLHPIDLAACKVQAVVGRGEIRDYEDVGVLAKERPEFLRAGVLQLLEYEGGNLYRALKAILSPPDDVILPDTLKSTLSDFISRLPEGPADRARTDKGLDL